MNDSPIWKVLGFCGVLASCVPAPVDHGDPQPGTGGKAGFGGAGGSKGTGGFMSAGGAPGTGGVATGSGGGPVVGGPGFLGSQAVNATGFAPPISGGTLLVLADGIHALAADPDRDKLYFADLNEERLQVTLDLQAGDEPGRGIEDASGTVHVVLRRGGAVVSVKPDRTLRERRPVCPAPRGIGYDAAADALVVACAGGELVTLPAAGGVPTRTLKLDRDLRDVVVRGDKTYVSTFRSAELLVLGADGKMVDRRRAPGSPAANRPIMTMDGAFPSASAGVAWRLRPLPASSTSTAAVAMIHQEASNGELGTQPGGYAGGPCKSPLGAAVASFPDGGGANTTGQMVFSVLPVDFAYSRDGKRMATVSAGNANAFQGRGLQDQVQIWNAQSFAQLSAPSGATAPPTSPVAPGDCMFPGQGTPPEEVVEFRQPVGETTSVDFDGMGRVVVQTREPARIEILTNRGGTIKLSDISRFDSGHAVFHVATVNGLACAACHPEGGDDGRVWRFAKIGARRTQNLRGGIGMSAPFHWDGDMRDLSHLMTEVFSGRMGGPPVDTSHVAALGTWMGLLPAVPGSAGEPAAVARGKALFNDAKVACATCHSGALLTNNTTVAVGTGKPFQVPSLKGIAGRAPFMHDGCAPTLMARFTAPCGGGDQHGVTSHLLPADLADLVTYLESL